MSKDTKGRVSGKPNTHPEKTDISFSELEEAERLERHLKNEAYAFLRSKKQIKEFLEFREYYHRTRREDVVYNAIMKRDWGGLWIDCLQNIPLN